MEYLTFCFDVILKYPLKIPFQIVYKYAHREEYAQSRLRIFSNTLLDVFYLRKAILPFCMMHLMINRQIFLSYSLECVGIIDRN